MGIKKTAKVIEAYAGELLPVLHGAGLRQDL